MGDEKETQKQLVAQLKAEISAHKLTEKGLREALRRANVAWEQAFQFIGLLTLDGTMVEVNRAPLYFAGIEKTDILGNPSGRPHGSGIRSICRKESALHSPGRSMASMYVLKSGFAGKVVLSGV